MYSSHDDFELEFIKSNLQDFRKEGNHFFGYIDGRDEKINLFVEHFMFLTSKDKDHRQHMKSCKCLISVLLKIE